ncbi:TorD/DmsD family molecular chaperone [Desulfosporosinus meridiei]|uniref:Putative component of anaerobic dehydrogenase n=1 Tax=Desulfosporosinus meridiei (strain ATCC BAA-275 / DSM 13257 / KCTC 12902 / NCIMB 13706 / S10) TaxID=768704 RepID=J7J5L0_DESMD|nr:molecular chaperone TorD family protein [Desulfosporosinus meridiei]AFQ46231.1 putative component of anaerobic dehydrogenase [Desulfosporosinus meridiei DSM 13257]
MVQTKGEVFLMRECAKQRTPEKYRAKINLLLALSRFFDQGGEQLAKTLEPLTKAAAVLLQSEGPQEMESAVKILEEYLNSSPEVYQALTYEFNRLFVGPAAPKAPPYESVYRSAEGLVMQEQTLAVRKMYLREGLHSQEQGHEPDDFIGTELEFMAYLLSRALSSEQEQNLSGVQYYLELHQEFCSKHMEQWVEAFAQAIGKSTDYPLYTALSKILVAGTQSSFCK